MICPKCCGAGENPKPAANPMYAHHVEWVRCPDCRGAGELPKPGTDQLRLECDAQAELPV